MEAAGNPESALYGVAAEFDTAGELYHAAVAPVGGGARNVFFAYLVNAVAIDAKFANSLSESTRAGVILCQQLRTIALERVVGAPEGRISDAGTRRAGRASAQRGHG